ncbi:MAG: phytanoyl-CoA dioxygenase family protein [Lentisphaeria bacterium]|nr:phytanoyl-CoA dioxygenase family protein [Lentisphaeria bacterium]NQZ69701.1 phytanoyl-CoA dioxygenase family protein [Lentisphaeria bacterium]
MLAEEIKTGRTVPNTGLISQGDLEQFKSEGFVSLENVIPADMLGMMREECSYFLGYEDCGLDRDGLKSNGITHRGNRYFIGNQYRLSQRLWTFIYSDLMAEISSTLLGDVFLFNEQWVVKGPGAGMKFSWHQDSGYIKSSDYETEHKPYLTCWCTLDDVCIDNGTVYILPHSRGGTSHTIFDHDKESVSNDLVGYIGDDPGDPVIVPAGSIIAFTSFNFHRSSPNTTPAMRRVYLAQYSSEPIVRSKTGDLWAQAVPFVKDGQIVYDHSTDTAERHGGAAAPENFEA